jgi:hypothetical protein
MGVVWGMDKVPIYFCCWHVLKPWHLHDTEKIKNVKMRGGILQDLHDVMYTSINHEKTINDFKEHVRVTMKINLHKHKHGDARTNYF